MSTREVTLDGGSPWGFRMHGGADVGQPLRISRVNPGSKAAQRGVREGDVISSINGQSTRNISNSDAHALLRNAGQTLHLGLNEECSGSPKRRIYRNVQDVRSTESLKRASSVSSNSSTTSTTTSTTVKSVVAVNSTGDATPAKNGPLGGDSTKKESCSRNGAVSKTSNSTPAPCTSTPDTKGREMVRLQEARLHVSSCDSVIDSGDGTGSSSRSAGSTMSSGGSKIVDCTDMKSSSPDPQRSTVSSNSKKNVSVDKKMQSTRSAVTGFVDSSQCAATVCKSNIRHSQVTVTSVSNSTQSAAGKRNFRQTQTTSWKHTNMSSASSSSVTQSGASDANMNKEDSCSSSSNVASCEVVKVFHANTGKTSSSIDGTFSSSKARRHRKSRANRRKARPGGLTMEEATLALCAVTERKCSAAENERHAPSCLDNDTPHADQDLRDSVAVSVSQTRKDRATPGKTENSEQEEISKDDIASDNADLVVVTEVENASYNANNTEATQGVKRKIEEISGDGCDFQQKKLLEEVGSISSVSVRVREGWDSAKADDKGDKGDAAVTTEVRSTCVSDHSEHEDPRSNVGNVVDGSVKCAFRWENTPENVLREPQDIPRNNDKKDVGVQEISEQRKASAQTRDKNSERNDEDEKKGSTTNSCEQKEPERLEIDEEESRKASKEKENIENDVADTVSENVCVDSKVTCVQDNCAVAAPAGNTSGTSRNDRSLEEGCCCVPDVVCPQVAHSHYQNVIQKVSEIIAERSEEDIQNIQDTNSGRKDEEEEQIISKMGADDSQSNIEFSENSDGTTIENHQENQLQESVTITDQRSTSLYTTLTEVYKITNSVNTRRVAGVTAGENYSNVEETNDTKIFETVKEEEVEEVCRSAQSCLCEHTAFIMEVTDDETWETVDTLQVSENDFSTDDRVEYEHSNMEDTPCVLTSNTTALNQNAETIDNDDEMVLSPEDKELLEPIPSMPAEEEENLRIFLQSLNLTECPEVPTFRRHVSVEEPVVMEDTPRRGKKRSLPDPHFTPYQRQRFLDVIQEENSDLSDTERKIETAKTEDEESSNRELDDSWIRAWEDAIYNPKTNEVIIITRKNEVKENEGIGVVNEVPSDDKMTVDIDEVEDTPVERKKERSMEEMHGEHLVKNTVIITESSKADDNTGSHRKVQGQRCWIQGKERLWRPGVVISEADSATASGEDENVSEQRIELAESSDETEPFDRRMAQKRRDDVEIIVLDDDSNEPMGENDDSVSKENAGVIVLDEDDTDNIEKSAPVMGKMRGEKSERDDRMREKTSQQHGTWRRGMASERQSNVEVVFLEDDSSTSESSMPVTHDEAEDADVEEEADISERQIKTRTSPKLRRISPHDTDGGNSEVKRKVVREKSPLKPRRHSPRNVDEDDEGDGENASCRVFKKVTQQTRTEKTSCKTYSCKMRACTSASDYSNGFSKVWRDNGDNVQKTGRSEEESENTFDSHVIMHKLQDNILDEQSTSPMKTTNTEQEINNKCHRVNQNSKTISTSISTLSQGDDDDICDNCRGMLQTKDAVNNVENIPQNSKDRRSTCDVRSEKRTSKDVTIIIKSAGSRTQASNTNSVYHSTNDDDDDDDDGKYTSEDVQEIFPPPGKKTACKVKFSHGAAFCYIDLPSQVTDRSAFSKIKAEQAKKTCEECDRDRAQTREKSPIDANNFEIIKRLLTVMPIQGVISDTNIYSSSSHLTSAQMSALSPSLRENINAFLAVSSDAQTLEPTKNTDAEVTAGNRTVKDADVGVDVDDELTPPLPSRPGSTSSDATSHNTALYNPSLSRASSEEADVSASCEDSAQTTGKARSSNPFVTSDKIVPRIDSPKSLREIALEAVISIPHGKYILEELGLQLIEHLHIKIPSHTVEENVPPPPVRRSHVNLKEYFQYRSGDNIYQRNSKTLPGHRTPSPVPPPVPKQYPSRYEPSPPRMESPSLPPVPSPPSEEALSADWMGLPTLADPRLLVCLSPAQRRHYQPTPSDVGQLLDLHCKFLSRRSYRENLSPQHALHVSSAAGNSGRATPPRTHSEDERYISPGTHRQQQISPTNNKYDMQKSTENRLSRQEGNSYDMDGCTQVRTQTKDEYQEIAKEEKKKQPTTSKKMQQDTEFCSPSGRGKSASPRAGSRNSVSTSPNAKISSRGGGQTETETASRLLAILRAASPSEDERRPESCPPPTNEGNMFKFVREYQDQEEKISLRRTASWDTLGSRPLSWADGEGRQARLKTQLLSEWLQLARTPTPTTENQNHSPASPVASLERDGNRQPENGTDKRRDEEEKFRLLTQQLAAVAREIEEKEHSKLGSQKRLSLPQNLSEKLEKCLQQKSGREETPKAEDKQEECEKEKRFFNADKYIISKKGDIAVFQNEVVPSQRTWGRDRPKLRRPKSMTEATVTDGELFRRQMYLEYMNQVAERAERRRQKVIRISTRPDEDIQQPMTEAGVKGNGITASENGDANNSNKVTFYQLESEFMGKVRERMDKLGLSYDESEDNNPDMTDSEVKVSSDVANTTAAHGENVDGRYIIDVSGGGKLRQLPKHLQEFLVLTADSDTDGPVMIAPTFKATSPVPGVWTPSQKASSSGKAEDSTSPASKSQSEQQQRKEEDATAVVWTPRSAGASPTAERKEFRPVNFESPTLHRKHRSPAPAVSKAEDSKATFNTPSTPPRSAGESPPVLPPWQREDTSTVSTSSTSSTTRMVQSQSAPASGLSVLASGTTGSTIKLPRAQNPTITLLQKAREGQLPRGALYLDHKMNSKDGDKPLIGPNEVLYTVKNEYHIEEGGKQKKIVELSPRKFEGIGPTTKEGIPIVLRSEIKDVNQAKWYKRMYDSLHRSGKDDEYITIRYKPRRGHYPYSYAGGYLSEPEPAGYDSDIGYSAKYATLDRRRIKNKENDFTTSTLPRSKYVPHPSTVKYATDVYKNQPGRIEDYEPGHSSISEKEAKQWWDEVLDIFDGWLDTHAPSPNYRSLLADAIYQRASTNQQTTPSTPSNKPFMTYALKESGYESDSTLVFKRRDENLQNQLSPAEQKMAYKTIQKGGEVPLHGLRKPAPERPKESPHRYVESEVTIHYRSPVRCEAKEALSEDELAHRQAEAMRRIYQEERRRKYLQELQDMHSRRHTDNFTPSQKSPIPLNRYDDFLDDVAAKSKPRDRTPEPKLVARALYNFVGQTSRELSFRRGDIIFVRRQIDKNWYEGEHNAMVGLFPFNYVEIIPYDGIRTIPKRPTEGQARAKFNFIAQTHLELSLIKGELIVLTRRVDDNWFEGRIGNRKGIFPVSYVEVLSEPGERAVTPATPSKPVASPASHSLLVNGSVVKPHHYQTQQTPASGYYSQSKLGTSYTSSNPYATLPRQGQTSKPSLAPMNQALHIDTHSEPVPYRALYNYRPQNEDELELCEGDTVYVMEKCDDGWYVGSSQRTGYFGTFPGNYVERL